MKRLAFAILTFLAAGAAQAQAFCDGYREGFKQASCHGTSIGCIPPIPPICPIPKIGETTWQHGYNRAFAEVVAPRQVSQTSARVGPMEGMKYVMDAGEAGRREGEARAQARRQQQATEADLQEPATIPRPDGTGAGMIRACRSLLGQAPPVKNAADTYVDAMQIQHCRSFIAGYHFARSMDGTEGEQLSKYCLPPGTTNEEIHAAVAFAPTAVAPGALAAPEGVLVAGALARRFPCD